MFELAVGTTPCELKQEDFRTLGQLSEGYSGSDITIAVQDALMQPVRKIQTATHYKKVRSSTQVYQVTGAGANDVLGHDGRQGNANAVLTW